MADDRKAPPPPHQRPVDTSGVDPKQVEALRAKARESVAEEKRKAAEAQLLKQFIAEERQRGGLDEEQVVIYLDLAPHADRLTIDGKVYFHGHTYTVPRSMYDSMREIMARGWDHQAEIDGKKKTFYRPQGLHVTESGGVVSNLLRA